MNELREANDEEGVGGSENDGDDALDLEQRFINGLLERQSELDGTNIVDKGSGRLPLRTPIHWTPTPVKTHLSEPEFNTVNNSSQWSELTFRLVFEK